jgi:WD40 repeat protein
MDCLMAGLLPTQRAEAMRRSTAAKLLVVVLTLLAGLASSFQWLRHPSRLHADLANRDYILVKFSPDGKTLITVERSPNDSLFDCRIRLWDMASGQEKQALATDWLIDEALLSRNGMFLAALWSGNQLRVWNTSTWQSWTVAWQDEPFDLDGPAMRFSPDSKMLAVEVRSHGCSVFDTATGQELAQFNGRLCNLAFAPDSQSVCQRGWVFCNGPRNLASMGCKDQTAIARARDTSRPHHLRKLFTRRHNHSIRHNVSRGE